MIKFLIRGCLRGACSNLQLKRMWSTLGRNGSKQLTAAGACSEGAVFHHISVDQETESGQEVGPEYKTPKSTHSDLFPLARFRLPRFLQPSITAPPAGVLVKHSSLLGTFRFKPQRFSQGPLSLPAHFSAPGFCAFLAEHLIALQAAVPAICCLRLHNE